MAGRISIILRDHEKVSVFHPQIVLGTCICAHGKIKNKYPSQVNSRNLSCSVWVANQAYARIRCRSVAVGFLVPSFRISCLCFVSCFLQFFISSAFCSIILYSAVLFFSFCSLIQFSARSLVRSFLLLHLPWLLELLVSSRPRFLVSFLPLFFPVLMFAFLRFFLLSLLQHCMSSFFELFVSSSFFLLPRIFACYICSFLSYTQ